METTPTVEQQSAMYSAPQEEHRWLKQFLGEWTYEGVSVMEPDGPTHKTTGAVTARPLGDLWVLIESDGAMPDGDRAQAIIQLGYDPQRGHFVGTWIGSMMTQMWVYEGQLDAHRRALPLNCEGPDFANPGQMAQYRDVIEVVSDDEWLLRGQVQGPDGSWTEFMKTTYRRKT